MSSQHFALSTQRTAHTFNTFFFLLLFVEDATDERPEKMCHKFDIPITGDIAFCVRASHFLCLESEMKTIINECVLCVSGKSVSNVRCTISRFAFTKRNGTKCKSQSESPGEWGWRDVKYFYFFPLISVFRIRLRSLRVSVYVSPGQACECEPKHIPRVPATGIHQLRMNWALECGSEINRDRTLADRNM